MPADRLPEADPDVRMTSFVLRFVHDRTGEHSPGERAGARRAGWHGLIRHVQSNEERHFSRWADAVAFIARYVEVEPAAVEPAAVEPAAVEPAAAEPAAAQPAAAEPTAAQPAAAEPAEVEPTEVEPDGDAG